MTDRGWAWATGDEETPWLEIEGEVTLPGAGVQTVRVPPEEVAGFELYVEIPDDLPVWPAAIEAMSEERRAELGLVAFDETAPPSGVKVTGKALVDQDGAPARAWLSEAFDGDQLAAFRAGREAEIDRAATTVITARYSITKQLNMTKRAVELTDKRIDGPLTEDEEAERQALKSAAAWVDLVRARAAELKAELPEDGPGMASFEIDGWPQ